MDNNVARTEKIDPVLVSKCVPTCVYRGFCPELKCCGYANTHQFHEAVENIERLNNYESAKRTGQIVDFDLEK